MNLWLTKNTDMQVHYFINKNYGEMVGLIKNACFQHRLGFKFFRLKKIKIMNSRMLKLL